MTLTKQQAALLRPVTCCRAKKGYFKKLYPTKQAAYEAINKATDPCEPYPCQTGQGYHIRKKRKFYT